MKADKRKTGGRTENKKLKEKIITEVVNIKEIANPGTLFFSFDFLFGPSILIILFVCFFFRTPSEGAASMPLVPCAKIGPLLNA